MKTTTTKKETKGTMGRTVSFQPTDEVRMLLERAKDAGLELSQIINDAISQRGEGVAILMAERRVRDAGAFLSNAKKRTG